MTYLETQTDEERLGAIERARRAVMSEGQSVHLGAPVGMEERDWIEQSWRRCLKHSRSPNQRVAFDMMSHEHTRRTAEANHTLVQAAKPVLSKIGRAIADTRYFAILTNAQGMVVDANGPIDRMDRRADLITRIGVDLSENSIGTSAIGTALQELHPVWLHRGEHFFSDMRYYSCAGAPVFGPDGQCAGMLDLTGIEQPERPELVHLVTQSARSIENALALARPHALLVRLNWPGRVLGDEADGLVCFDADGWVAAANSIARQMVARLNTNPLQPVHASELFALPFENLFDAVRIGMPIEVPLWSGLRLNALSLAQGQTTQRVLPRSDRLDDQLPLKDVEIALIRKAVDDSKGNVTMAARALGISRATVYRKLGLGTRLKA